MGFFFLCLFPHQRKEGISLQGLCRYLIEQGIQITKQSLQDRFTESSVNFLKRIFSHALRVRLKTTFVHQHYEFGRIVIDDSTVFELPEKFDIKYRGSGGGASKAAIKVHYCFDLLSGNILDIRNIEGIQPDQTIDLPDLEPNDLLIEDLGFFRIDRFKRIIQLKAWFLSRLKLDTRIFLLNAGNYEVLDLLNEERKMQSGEIRVLNVFIGTKDKLPVRLIIEKVHPQISAEKRRKLKYDKQNKRKNLTARRLKLCNLNVHVTNTSEIQIPKEIVRKFYSLRWQIEIMFKAWKSIYKIDGVRSMKIERFECMHYGLLILIVLTHQFFAIFKNELRKNNNVEISELKFFSCMKETLPMLNNALNRKQKLRYYLIDLWKMIQTTCTKDQKLLKQSPYSILKLVA